MTNIQCPDCRGAGKVYDQVEWSDGLGGVTCTCDLCDGKGALADPLAQLREYKRAARAVAADYAQLRRHVLCFIDTSDPKRKGHVRGMPGASPHASTWLDYLKQAANAVAPLLVAEVRAVESADHAAGHHAEPPPPHDCPRTNARRYCTACAEVQS